MSLNKPLVTIVTPSFNQADFIEQTILSVKNQDYPNIEHIVMDGGSNDGTVEILKKYPHLIWSSERDKGQSDAINKGFKLAGGDILAWLNSDDFYLPGAISAMVSEASKHPDFGIIYGDIFEVDEHGKTIRELRTSEYDINQTLNSGNMIYQPAAFISRKAADTVGLLNDDYHYAMDYEWWLRITKKYAAYYVPKFWASFRLHGASKTVSMSEKFWREERRAMRENGGKWLSDAFLRHWGEKYPHIVAMIRKIIRIVGNIRVTKKKPRSRS